MRGPAAESLVARYLVRLGRRIVARNYRAAGGEIDLVVLEGDLVAFVEVRARAPDGRVPALETVDARKRRRLERAAQAFLCARRLDGFAIRFDVAAVTGDEIDYVQDAW